MPNSFLHAGAAPAGAVIYVVHYPRSIPVSSQRDDILNLLRDVVYGPCTGVIVR